MQRQTLVPLSGLTGRDGAPPRILEVACGTGRFATFVRDNFPTAEVRAALACTPPPPGPALAPQAARERR